MTLAVVFHRLGPYHVARLQAAARRCKLTAIELSATTGEYAWDAVTTEGQFERLTLFPEGDSRKQNTNEVCRRMEATLNRISPSVMAVPGWSDAGALAALRWAAQRGVPTIAMSESTPWDEPRKWWKEAVKRRVTGLFASALVGGVPHAQYLNSLEMPESRIYLGYDAVDNDYFATEAAKVRSQSSVVRRQFNLPERFFLASARFIEKKNLLRLLEAYARYRKLAVRSESRNQKVEIKNESPLSAFQISASPPWSLVLLGDGPLRTTLNSQLSTLSLHDCVHLPGFKQYPELPAFYGLASAFVHASTTEQWGLVVNEAMASSLPVLVSNRCGCAPDLVEEGVNGFTFDPYNFEQLAGLMVKLSNGHVVLSQMGAASQRIIANWGPERFASGLEAAAQKALEVGSRRPNWQQRLLLTALIKR